MRTLVLAGLLLATASRAQAPAAPSPAVQAPSPASPATGHAKPPAPARVDDAVLLRAVLWATRPAPEEIRTLAIEDLALLGDARALDPLATLLWDPNPRIQQAVLRAVALFQDPRAEEILGGVVRHARMPDALKIQALSGLIFQRTESARRTVRDATTDAKLSTAVQNAARTVSLQWDATPTPGR